MPSTNAITNITDIDELFARIEEYLAPEQVAFVRKAYELAAKAHAAQTRKSGEPYIIHPIGVVSILVGLQMDDKTLAAAFLHDVVEDTDYKLDYIKEQFGTVVANLVDGVTKLGKIEYISKEDRQIENYRKMFLAMARDIRVVLIKLADRLHNMRTMKYMPVHKQQSISRETLEIYAPLAHRLGIYTIKWELEDLAFRYMEPDIYYDLVEQVKIKRREREDMINEAMTTLKDAVEKAGIRCEIQGRPKNFYSIHKKMLRDHKQLSEIYDLLAIRVLVDTVKDCYGTLGIVHSMWRPIPGRFKDYVAVPKSNMYQSLHTTVLSNGGQPLEIQIRTFEMHRISEYGIAAHWRYKESGGSKPAAGGDKGFDAKLSWLRQLLEWHKDMNDSRDFVNTVKMDIFADEVFVFTPRGDVIDLPVGSVPIDFAYRIHTDVGNRCVGAKVNGRIVTLDSTLSNGDIVEIITSKASKGPSRDWLKIAKSSEARSKIRQWFKKEKKDENIVNGRSAFEAELKHCGLSMKDVTDSELLPTLLKKVAYPNLDDMYAAIGYGGFTAQKAVSRMQGEINRVLRQRQQEQQALEAAAAKPKEEAAHIPAPKKIKSEQGIIVEGLDNCLVKFSKCCSPVPGDDIVGFITRGYGVSVHRSDCPNVLRSRDNPAEAGRWIRVSWADKTSESYHTMLQIVAKDRISLIVDVSTVLSATKTRVLSLNARSTPDGFGLLDLGIEVSDREQLKTVMNRLEQIQGVMKVTRPAG